MVRSFFDKRYLYTLKFVKVPWQEGRNAISGRKTERVSRSDLPVGYHDKLYQIDERTRPSKMIVHD